MKRFLGLLLAGLLLASPAAATTIRIFITSGTTWTVPDDWNSQDNTIEIVGGGGIGDDCGGLGSAGGGGGGYSAISNFSAAPGASIPVSFVANNGSTGVGGLVSLGSGPSVKAQNGNDYNPICTGGTVKGGQAASGIGTTKFNGGDGGLGSGGGMGTGAGGGAAGPHGAGAKPITDSGIGGAADAGFGGAGGVGTRANGGAGTEWDASHGTGGGGGSDGAGNGGLGGRYGGGGGYAKAGFSGLIVITYTTRRRVSSGVF